MRIVGVVTLLTTLAPGLRSGTIEPTGDEAGLDPSVSYLHVQQVPEPRIWLDRGADPVLEAGDRVRVYYRTNADAYVAILRIDTDGTTRMLYPRSPTERHYARADRDYRLLFPRSAYWNVDDRPGVGYFFVVTSPTPFDLSDFGYSNYGGGWDLSAVGSTVYSDPFVAMDDYVARLVPDWEYLDYGLDFVSYSVGGAHEYPRFLCYQCHGFRPYSTWNPYRYTCVDFRVVVYDDPYFYPSRRYRADRVVLVRPRNPTRMRFGFKERAPGEPGNTPAGTTPAGTPLVVVRQPERGDPPPVADRPRTDQRADGGRVASPPVVPSVVPTPTTTRRRDISAPTAVPRRPTLERRSVAPRPAAPGRAPHDASVDGGPSAVQRIIIRPPGASWEAPEALGQLSSQRQPPPGTGTR